MVAAILLAVPHRTFKYDGALYKSSSSCIYRHLKGSKKSIHLWVPIALPSSSAGSCAKGLHFLDPPRDLGSGQIMRTHRLDLLVLGFPKHSETEDPTSGTAPTPGRIQKVDPPIWDSNTPAV